MQRKFTLLLFFGLLLTSFSAFSFDGDLSVLRNGRKIKIATSQGLFKFKFDHVQGDSLLIVRNKDSYIEFNLAQVEHIYIDKRCTKPGMAIGRTAGEFLGLITGFGFAIVMELDESLLMEAGSYSFGQILQLPGALLGLALPRWVEI